MLEDSLYKGCAHGCRSGSRKVRLPSVQKGMMAIGPPRPHYDLAQTFYCILVYALRILDDLAHDTRLRQVPKANPVTKFVNQHERQIHAVSALSKEHVSRCAL